MADRSYLAGLIPPPTPGATVGSAADPRLDFGLLAGGYEDRLALKRDLAGRIDDLLGQALGPTGIPDRLTSASRLFNPISQGAEAGGATITAFDDTQSPEVRRQAAIDAVTGTLGAAAPAIAGKFINRGTANALWDTLVGIGNPLDTVTGQALADTARGTASDLQYAGRSALQGDLAGVAEAFTPSRAPRGIGADVPNAPQGILAYHGSPHTFDRFSLDAIGTGEGAQAYGHGLYFAENPDVARGYRDNVFGAVPREMFQSDEAHQIVNNQLQGFGATPDALDSAIDDLRKSLMSAEGTHAIWKDQQPRIDALNEAIGFLENKADTRLMIGNKTVSDVYNSISSRADRLPPQAAEAEYGKMALLEDLMNDGDILGVMQRADAGAYDPSALAWFEKEVVPNFKRPGSSLYEVKINARPEDFLDWDAPLSEQTGRVSQLLSDYEALGSPINYATGGDWMSEMARDYFTSGSENPASDVSAYLARENIPGVKYLDAMSRGAGEGSRNYVVFDENLIDIVKRYGIAGAATMLGMSQLDLENAMRGQQQPVGLLGSQV